MSALTARTRSDTASAAGPSLFAAARASTHDAPRPLADKLRPQKLADVSARTICSGRTAR